MHTSQSTNRLDEPVPPTLPQVAVVRTTPTGTIARKDEPSDHSSGHDEVVSRVVDVCEARSATPLVIITGPAGIGRSSVLAQVHAKLTERGIATTDIRIPRADLELPHLVAGLADGLGLPPACGESSTAALLRLSVALSGRRDRLVVFLDDAHRLGPDSRAALTSSISALAGAQVTFVCAIRTPANRLSADLDALRARELVHEERLRPLTTRAVEQLLTGLLRAKPMPGLAASIRNASRGIPAVVHAALEGYRRSGCLQTVDWQTRLVGNRPPRLPIAHPLFAGLRRAESPTRAVANALAVLHPLHGAVPALIAETVGIDEEAVLEALHELRAAGVLLPQHRSGNWRFRVPMLATLLAACLGPYERRRSSRVAVTALWNGTATCPDDAYLPERIVDASRLVDKERAAEELLAGAASADDDLADRWRWAAASYITDPARRAAVLHRHAVACALHQRFNSATLAADVALHSLPDQLPPDSLLELQIIYAVGLASGGDVAGLRELAQDSWRSMPGGEANRTVTRATALCMLNRWHEAHDQVAGDEDHHGAATLFGRVIAEAADARPGGVPGTEDVGRGQVRQTETTADVARMLARALGLDGWLDQPGKSGSAAFAPAAAVRAGFSGRWDDALDLARSDIAAASVHGHGPGRTATFREAAVILTARGHLTRARAMLEDARSHHLLLPHVLAVPEAELETTVGAVQRARTLIEDGLALAAGSGAVAGTDELWLLLAEAESRRGNLAAARKCVARIERIATRLGTAGARRSHLLARLLIEPDSNTAEEVIELATARNRPFELASTLAAVAESSPGEPELIRTAYEMFGELGALLPRARLRRLMRTYNIAVPGRSATVAENERLLAALITEGLTNSQLATVLGTSEKSVEGRLTRLFSRTGYRSRTEVAAATLSGYPSLAA